MTKEGNLPLLQRFGEGINTGNYQLFYEVVDAKSVDHDPGPGQGLGPEGFEHFFSELRTAFPDLKVDVEHLVADDDNLAFAYVLTGTNKGSFMGFAPTGKTVSVRGMQISKFANGKMVERWGSSDQLGMLQQLGLAPSP